MTQWKPDPNELRAAGYRGTGGLILLAMLIVPIATIVFGTIYSIILSMLVDTFIGKNWSGGWVYIAGYALGALAGLGFAIQRVEKGNLKARALVHAANGRQMSSS